MPAIPVSEVRGAATSRRRGPRRRSAAPGAPAPRQAPRQWRRMDLLPLRLPRSSSTSRRRRTSARTAIAQINVKLYLRCAQCMFKLDSQLYLRVCTLTTHIARLRACCCTSATTMDQWSIWWSPSTTSHAHSLLNIHLELQLRFESLQKESH